MKKNFKISVGLLALAGALASCGSVASTLEEEKTEETITEPEDELALVEETSTKALRGSLAKASVTTVSEAKPLLSIKTGDNPGMRFKCVLSDSCISSSFKEVEDLSTLTYGVLVTKTKGTSSIEDLLKDQTLEEGENTIEGKTVYNCVTKNGLFDQNQVTFAGVLTGFESKETYDTYYSSLGYVSDGETTVYTKECFASYSYAIEEYLTNAKQYGLSSSQIEELNGIKNEYEISSSFDATSYIAKDYNVNITKADGNVTLESNGVSDTSTKATYSAIKFTPNEFYEDYSKLTLKFTAKFENLNYDFIQLMPRLNNETLVTKNICLTDEIQDPGINLSKNEDESYTITLNFANLFYDLLADGTLNLDYLRIQFSNKTITTAAKVIISSFEVSKTTINDMKADPELFDLSNTLVSAGGTEITKTAAEKYDGSNYSVLLNRNTSSSSATRALLPITYSEITDKNLVFYAKPTGAVADGYIRLVMVLCETSSSKVGSDATFYIPVSKSHNQSITNWTCTSLENGWYKCEASMPDFIAKTVTETADTTKIKYIRFGISDSAVDTYSLYMDSMQFVSK